MLNQLAMLLSNDPCTRSWGNQAEYSMLVKFDITLQIRGPYYPSPLTTLKRHQVADSLQDRRRVAIVVTMLSLFLTDYEIGRVKRLGMFSFVISSIRVYTANTPS